MSRITLKIEILLLITVLSLLAKVLIVTDNEYYGDSTGYQKLEQYITDIQEVEGDSVDTLVFEILPGDTGRNGCKRLWDYLSAEYYNAIQSGDTLKGAVLIGNLPIPMFAYGESEDYSVYPVDYYYMDIWNKEKGQSYISDLRIWTYPTYDTIIDTVIGVDTTFDTTLAAHPWFNRNYYDLDKGDTTLDIWVSRIYTENIEFLREEAKPWADTSFLTSHEIINNYLDRVHARMRDVSKIPPRAFSIGTNNFTTLNYSDFTPATNIRILNKYLRLDLLNTSWLRHFVLEDAHSFKWQSQLQAGPYGNIHSGSYKGQRFGPAHDTVNTYPEYYSDTSGYEWASLFEHSGPGGHVFDQRGEACIPYSGGFGNFSNCSLWVDTSFNWAYGGTAKITRNRDKVSHDYGDNMAVWVDTLLDTISHPEGEYDVYMWYKPKDGNDQSYINVFVNHKKPDRCGCLIDQSVDYPPDDTPGSYWQKLDIKPVVWRYGQRIDITFNANHHSTAVDNDTAVADAVKLVPLNGGIPIIIDDSDPGFQTGHDYGRGFLNMVDDGGPSKSKFFLLQACHISQYNEVNCLGNLYAMAYKGLTSLGASSSDYVNWTKDIYVESLNNGDCFGEAFRKLAQNRFLSKFDRDGTYSFSGAGTLKSKAYKPYFDYITGNITDTSFTDFSDIYIKDEAFLHNNVTVQDGAELKIFSGEDIIITPKFLADYGSKLDLQVKPYLY